MSTDKPEGRIDGARWLLAMGGFLAGLAAFGIGEAIHEIIPAELVTSRTMGRLVTTPTMATQSVADVRNAALAFGVLAACLGGLLGIAGGLARRSAAGAIAAALLGSTLGAVLVAAMSFALLKFFMDAQIAHEQNEILISLVMHGLIWGMAGACAGVAFAVGLGRPRLLVHAAVTGLAGALLGAIAFELLGAGFFPLADTSGPISTNWPSRLMARLLVTTTTAVAMIVSLPLSRTTPAAGRSQPQRSVEPNPAVP